MHSVQFERSGFGLQAEIVRLVHLIFVLFNNALKVGLIRINLLSDLMSAPFFVVRSTHEAILILQLDFGLIINRPVGIFGPILCGFVLQCLLIRVKVFKTLLIFGLFHA